jgi:thioredoxin reductase
VARLAKPFPPGEYPVVIIGSGPGGLQTSYFLKKLRVPHAIVSADPGPAGMFRRFPFFDRLISWSKPYAPAERPTEAYERYDWNSLLADKAQHRALVPKFMDGTSYFPRRSEMEQGLASFAGKCGIKVRFGCKWEGTAKSDGGFILSTSDGDYAAKLLIFAIGVTDPWAPRVTGGQFLTHYIDLKKPKDYAGRRVFIIGKRNSAFETANGLLPWASRIIMASPSPVRFSIVARHPSAARAVYMQPYEDYVLGGGNYVLDGVPERVEKRALGFRVHVSGTTVPGKLIFEVDEVIAATGFQTPLLDLNDLGVQFFGQQRFPSLTNFWESTTVPGIFFTGATMQGAPGLTKYGRASSSGVVHGFRQNAKVLAEHIAMKHFDYEPVRRKIPQRQLVGYLLNASTESGELWNQQAYLCRVVSVDENKGIVEGGVQPLAHFVDSGGEDAIAITVETDAEGDQHPAVYFRRRGTVTEQLLSTGLLLDFRTKENRAQLDSLIKDFLK